MTDRIPLDHLTSDQLDALYEQLEAAEESESQRQLATAREALASATTRAARTDAATERVRALHHRNEHTGDCEHCSAGDYPNYSVPHPCPTIRALDEEPTP